MNAQKSSLVRAKRWVVVGGLILLCLARCFGLTWTHLPSFSAIIIASMAYGNGAFVAVDYAGAVFTSPDGTNWTTHAAGTTALFGVPTSLVFANSNFMAVGKSASNAVVQMSSDGILWGSPAVLGPGSLNSVAWGNGTYVCVGQTSNSGLVAVSSDGSRWNSLALTNAGTLSAVAFGKNMFVLTVSTYDSTTDSYTTKIFTSVDGLTWALEAVRADIYVKSMAYGNGIFVAGGLGLIGNPVCLVSEDGIHWRGPSPGVYSVSFGNAFFLGDSGNMLSSTDGVNWRYELGGNEYVGFTWTYGQGKFLVTTIGVFESQDLSSYCFMSGLSDNTGAFHLTVMGGRTRQEYRIQGSTDLTGTNWTDVFSFTNSLTTDFLDSAATNYPQRFYRVVSP